MSELFHGTPPPTLEFASIGWEAEEEYIFPGDESNDGHTLVRVQLFRGRDVTRPLNSSRAQGVKLIAHVNSLGGFRTPPKDTRCMVAIPAGLETTPGAAMIIGVAEKSSARFDNLPNGSTAMSAGQGEARVITRNDGSIALYTTDDNTREGEGVYVRVAPDAIQFRAPWGTMRFDASGFHVALSSGASYDLGAVFGLGDVVPGGQVIEALSTYASTRAHTIINAGTTQMNGDAGVQDALVLRSKAKIVHEAHRQQAFAIFNAITAAVQAYTTALTGGTAAATAAFAASIVGAWPALQGPFNANGSLIVNDAMAATTSST
jgi:hypothetical protein